MDYSKILTIFFKARPSYQGYMPFTKKKIASIGPSLRRKPRDPNHTLKHQQCMICRQNALYCVHRITIFNIEKTQTLN